MLRDVHLKSMMLLYTYILENGRRKCAACEHWHIKCFVQLTGRFMKYSLVQYRTLFATHRFTDSVLPNYFTDLNHAM